MKKGRTSTNIVAVLLLVLCCYCLSVLAPKAKTGPVPTDSPEIGSVPSAGEITETAIITPSSTPTISPTIPPLTETAQMIALAKTAAAQFKTGTAPALADYKYIAWQELVNHITNHIGEHIKLSGVVSQILGEEMFQMNVGGNHFVVVVTADPFFGLYLKEWIWVYGSVEGMTCSEGIPVCLKDDSGADLQQPLLTFGFWTLT